MEAVNPSTSLRTAFTPFIHLSQRSFIHLIISGIFRSNSNPAINNVCQLPTDFSTAFQPLTDALCNWFS